MRKAITYVELDVHKDTIVVSFAEAGLRGELREVREYGKIVNTPAAVKALATKLAAKETNCGSVMRLARAATASSGSSVGWDTNVPSLVPRKLGERIKTDRRDAIKLAKMHRADELTPIWVPDQAHEAVRDLVRARPASVRVGRPAVRRFVDLLSDTAIRTELTRMGFTVA